MKTTFRKIALFSILILSFMNVKALENTLTCRIVTFRFPSNNNYLVSNETNKALYQASTANNQWYEIPAGLNSNGKQLYYYKNVGTNKYLYCGNIKNGENSDWFCYELLVSEVNLYTDDFKWALVVNPTQTSCSFLVNSNGYTNQSAESQIKDGNFKYVHNFIQYSPLSYLFLNILPPNALCGINKSDISGNVWCQGVTIGLISSTTFNPDYTIQCGTSFKINAMGYYINNQYNTVPITDVQKTSTSSFRKGTLRADGLYNATNINSGEWVSYKINPCVSGNYKVVIYIANNDNTVRTQTLKLNSNIGSVLGTITTTKTTNLNTYKPFETTVNLNAGTQTLCFIAGSNFNLWYITFEYQMPTPIITCLPLNSKQIEISWSNPNGFNYDVYRSDTFSGVYSKIGTTNSNNYIDTNLNTFTTYFYKIIGHVDELYSSYSNTADATTNLQINTDTIVWTNNFGNGDWDNLNNWIDYSTKQPLNIDNSFSPNLTVIIPSLNNSKYLEYNVNNNNGIVYPHSKIPTVVKYSDELYMKNIIIEYGAALYIEPLFGKYNTAKVELKIEDRNEWILIGPNINPDNRPMVSGDYYLNATPQVYMNEMILTNNVVSWGSSFANMDKVIIPNKCFAIRIPDQYGKYKVSGKYFYRNDPTKPATIGSDPIEYTFTGKFLNEAITPTIVTKPDSFVVSCNTFASNINVQKFLNIFGGQIAVWSFNDESDGTAQKGSFTTYNSVTAPNNLYIKPMQSFMYLDGNTTSRTITLIENDICDVNYSTKYRAKSEKTIFPTLQIIAINDKYSSKMSIVYNENLSNCSFDFNKDLIKLFSGYEQTPDMFSYLNNYRLQSQTINNLNENVNLGIKIGVSDTVKLNIIGANNFNGVSLIDKQTGISYDLKGDTTKIELEILSGTNSDRFYIKFKQNNNIITDFNKKVNNDSLEIYTEDKRIIISNSEYNKINSISIINISGHVTIITPTNENCKIIDMSNYPVGVYIIQIETENGVKTKKIILK